MYIYIYLQVPFLLAPVITSQFPSPRLKFHGAAVDPVSGCVKQRAVYVVWSNLRR